MEKRGNRARPKWSDFNLVDIYDVVPFCCVRDVREDEADFPCRFWGTKLGQLYGVDCTGKRIADTYSTAAAGRTRSIYQAALASDRPIRVTGNLGYVDRSEFKFFEAIFLRLDGDDGPDRHVIGCFEFVHELDAEDMAKLEGGESDKPGLMRWMQSG